MSQITLFRLTAQTDTQATDRIIFNDKTATDFKKSKREGAYCSQLERFPTKGLGDNQGVGQDLSDIQSVGNVEDVYRITGYIEKRSGNDGDGRNAFLTKLKAWDEDPPVNASWEEGRFGLVDDGDHNKDVIPVRTGGARIGLIWENISYHSVFGKDREEIVINLRVAKGDGE